MGRELDNYYNSPRLSQSKLKLLLVGVRAFNEVKEPELFFEEKQHFIIGSAVDTYLTRGVEQFNQEFYVSILENKPSDTVKSIINEVFSKANINIEQIGIFAPRLDEFKDLVLESCNNHSYQSNWKDETRVNKILENYSYWEELVESNGKTILTTEDKRLIDEITTNFLNSDSTNKYFTTFADDIEILNQLHIDFQIDDVECKALLDGVIVNHFDKTLQPYDIKTIGDKVINFPKSLRRHNYQIQAAWYTEALNQWKKNSKFEKYKILNFDFLVESTVEPGYPMVFTCDDELLYIGKYGRPEIAYSGEVIFYPFSNEYANLPKEIKQIYREALVKPAVIGYNKLLQAYKYYRDIDDWSVDKCMIDGERVIGYDTNISLMDCF